MKKSDFATILLIASTSVIISFFVAQSIFGNVYQGTARVKVIDKIDSIIIPPSPDIFNKNAINPAVKVEVTGTK